MRRRARPKSRKGRGLHVGRVRCSRPAMNIRVVTLDGTGSRRQAATNSGTGATSRSGSSSGTWRSMPISSSSSSTARMRLSTGIVGMSSATLHFRDERVGRFGSLGDLLLSEIQLVAALADVGGDPVLLAQGANSCVLVASLAVLLAVLGSALCRLGNRLSLRGVDLCAHGASLSKWINKSTHFSATGWRVLARRPWRQPSGWHPSAA